MSVRKEIEALLPEESSHDLFRKLESLRDRVLHGESTGDRISDFVFLNYAGPKKTIEQIDSELRQLQETVSYHVGERILIQLDYRSPSGCADSRPGVIYDHVRSYRLGIIRRGQLRLHFDESEKFGKSRHPDLLIVTDGFAVKRKSLFRDDILKFEETDMHVAIDPKFIGVGDEAIRDWRDKDPGNEKIYQELSEVLAEGLTNKSSQQTTS